MLERVGLGGTHEGNGHRNAVAVHEVDGAADGDGERMIDRLGILGVGQDGLDLGDAGGVFSLLLLGVVVLGVLRKVAEVARGP